METVTSATNPTPLMTGPLQTPHYSQQNTSHNNDYYEHHYGMYLLILPRIFPYTMHTKNFSFNLFPLQDHQGQCQELLVFLVPALHLVEKVHFIHLPNCYEKQACLIQLVKCQAFLSPSISTSLILAPSQELSGTLLQFHKLRIRHITFVSLLLFVFGSTVKSS